MRNPEHGLAAFTILDSYSYSMLTPTTSGHSNLKYQHSMSWSKYQVRVRRMRRFTPIIDQNSKQDIRGQ